MESAFVYAPKCEKLDHTPIETLLEMREKGMSNLEIAKHFGCSDSKISTLLPPKYRRLSDDDRTGIVRAWNQQKNKTEIAIMFGCSESTVVETLRKSGINIPYHKQHWTTSELNRVRRCLEKGMTYGEIAVELGRSIESVKIAAVRYSLNKSKPEDKVASICRPRRIDGTPMPDKKPEPVKETVLFHNPVTDEWSRAPKEIVDDAASTLSAKLDEVNETVAPQPAGLSLEEEHIKTITGRYGTYILNCIDNMFDFELFAGNINGNGFESFCEFAKEVNEVCRLMKGGDAE